MACQLALPSSSSKMPNQSPFNICPYDYDDSMSKSSFPGGLRGIPGIQTEAPARLLAHYDAYEPLLQSCRDGRLELESPLTSPAKQQVLESLDPAAAEKVGGRSLIPLVEHEIIEDLAKRWNLHRIPEVQDSLHWNFKDGVAHIGDPMGTQILRPFTFFGGGQLVPWEFKVSFDGRDWSWSPTSTRSFKDFRYGVMRDLGGKRLRSLPSELRECFRELAKVASDVRRYDAYEGVQTQVSGQKSTYMLI